MKTIVVPVAPHQRRLLDAKDNAVLQQLITATPEQLEQWFVKNTAADAGTVKVLVALVLGLRHALKGEIK